MSIRHEPLEFIKSFFLVANVHHWSSNKLASSKNFPILMIVYSLHRFSSRIRNFNNGVIQWVQFRSRFSLFLIPLEIFHKCLVLPLRRNYEEYAIQRRGKYLVDKLFMVFNDNRELFKFTDIKLFTTKYSFEAIVYFHTDLPHLYMYFIP